MFESKEIQIPAAPGGVKSLCWDGDTLVDWVAGGNRYHLDGGNQLSKRYFAFPFDAAVTSPSGEYAVVYAKLDTKALLLHKGEIVRELNRSYYHANVHEYPIVLFRLANGQEVMAHCPDEYCRIEIEDVATGTRLTAGGERKPEDFFVSRLAVSSTGKFLCSAGWVWQPMDLVVVYDVEEALRTPAHLDGPGLNLGLDCADNCSATFADNDRLVVAHQDDVPSELMDGKFVSKYPDAHAPDGELCVLKLEDGRKEPGVKPQDVVGTLMPIDTDHAIGFYDHPKLFDLGTGAVVRRWPHIRSGNQQGCILGQGSFVPPQAFDITHRRFAVADESEIKVVQLADRR